MTEEEHKEWMKECNRTFHRTEIIRIDLDYEVMSKGQLRRTWRLIQEEAKRFLGSRRVYYYGPPGYLAEVCTKSAKRALRLFRKAGFPRVKRKDIWRDEPYASLLDVRRSRLVPGEVKTIQTRR